MRNRFVPVVVLAGLAMLTLTASLGAQASTTRDSAQNTPAWLAANRAQLGKESYAAPTDLISKLVTAPRHLNVSLTLASPNRKLFLKEQSEGMPSVTTFGKQHYYLGGLQVDGKANRNRSLTNRGATGLQLVDPATGKTIDIAAPKGASLSGAVWAPDSKQIAFLANFDDATQVFVADVTTGKSVQISKTPLLATLVTAVDWTADGKGITVVQLPDGRKAEPKRPEIATGPLVRTWTDGNKDPERNFWSLLQDPYEQELLEYYTTGQLALLDVKTKTSRKIGAPAMISAIDASPDGSVFRVTTMQKPFSYVTQYTSFGTNEELWDASGKLLATIQKRPLRLGSDTTGGGAGGRGGRGGESKRGLAWMPAGPGLYFIESVPAARGDSANGAGAGAGRGAAGGGRGGAGAGAAARPDRVVQWTAPFGTADTKVMYTADGPITNLSFTDDAKMLFVAATSNGTGDLYAVNLAEPTKKYSLIRQRGFTPSFLSGRGGRGGGAPAGGRGGAGDDSLSFFTNPGAMITRRGTLGGSVAMVSSDGAVFLQGTQYFRDYLASAPREFVDKVDIKTGTKTRIFEGAKDAYEAVGAALDDDFSKIIVTRETATAVADAYVRDVKAGTGTKLTNNVDYSPEFTNLVRKRVTVTRPDGIHFIVKLTLPANYQAGTRLPGMFWFYPYEYTDQAGYERTLRTENVNRFPVAGPRTIEFLATQGYAVANFDPPIMGEAGRMNDNYISDLVMNLSAVIDELDKQGFIDRARLGIGGHSYGAFSTMNAMTHTPFFKAGIAGDGMYNRTLTPTGFQSERRDLWSGQKTYLEMSPMLVADKMQGAILMYHSLEDQNVGTDPVSSIRMMQALRANGKTASLYMYPYEDHGPATKETMLDQWARWTAWLDTYVKHAGDPALKKAPPAAPATPIIP
ncbi:MAG: prolyl oligopeptidase family serine peptidase [Gemmatimonadetes bacterium]|nr:prolyl oligopeptidase family serine peptidase [Gemmatimonadota bacterium]